MPTGERQPANSDTGGERPKREPITTPDFFEEKLRELRRRLGWTQADLGTFFGVSKITAHRWDKQGTGETEARKAALRLVEDALERSPAPEKQVGKALLNAGVVRAVTAAVHESPDLSEGGINRPVGWKPIFDLRERLGWTQTEFARFLGVTHAVPTVWENPDTWKDGRDPLGNAIRAALLALDFSSDPGRPYYPEPRVAWHELKTEGFGAFCKEICELRIDP